MDSDTRKQQIKVAMDELEGERRAEAFDELPAKDDLLAYAYRDLLCTM